MTLNGALFEFLTDTVTIEPYTGMTGAQVPTYGAAVTYAAQISSAPFKSGIRRVTGRDGKEIDAQFSVLIPDRVFVDPRSRITLPAGFVPNQPAIMGVSHTKFQDLDHTEVLL